MFPKDTIGQKPVKITETYWVSRRHNGRLVTLASNRNFETYNSCCVVPTTIWVYDRHYEKLVILDTNWVLKRHTGRPVILDIY